MPEPTVKLSKMDLGLAWTNAVVWLFATAWGSVPGLAENPLPGLRRIAAELWLAWPIALAILCVAVGVSVPRWCTARRLHGVSMALVGVWLVACLYVSPGPAVGLVLLATTLGRCASGQKASAGPSAARLAAPGRWRKR